MLFNPNWNKPKPDIFTLESLIAWLEKQPPFEHYQYDRSGSCLLAQYFVAMGFHDVRVSSTAFCHYDGRGRSTVGRLPTGWDEIACAPYSLDHTFGGALSRAHTALKMGLCTASTPAQ